VANRRYLGTGKVTVDGNSELTLGNVGATSNATGDDYTAINGARINIASGTNGVYTSDDTFNIAANNIIAGGSASGQGLASLTRGTNITLASGAIIAHNGLSAALNLATGTIQNLGTNADLYYGLNGNQANAAGIINIGNGTAFRGISTDRTGRNWGAGTINIASGTTGVDFQGHATHTNVSTLALTNGVVITSGVTGTVDINARGPLTLDNTNGVFGDTGAGQNVRFVATAGSTLRVNQAAGMGTSTGIASALVNNGGSLTIGNSASLNGNVTVEAGGRFTANQATGLTGIGALTFNQGSILNITNNTGWSGAQASAATIAAGTIVSVTAGSSTSPGTAGETLDSFFDDKSVIYQINGDISVPDPTSPDTTTLTLNKNGSGVGGILTNGSAGGTSYFRNKTNGHITIGANGGLIAATSGTELQVTENIVGTNITLTFGTTDIIDGAPKLGTVAIGPNVGANTYTGENIINAGSVRTAYTTSLGDIANQLTVNTGATLNMSGTDLTVGNLTGTGGIINAAGRTLTIGQGDNGGGNYQGSIQGTNGKLTKTGTNTITLSGANTYTGVTTVSAGTLELGVDDCLSNSSNVVLGAATLKAAAGVDDTVGNLDPTAAATINLGSGATLAFAASNGVNWSGGTLNITGTFVSGSSLRFGTTSGGLTAGQLLQISATGWTGFGLDADGYLTATAIGGTAYQTWATANEPFDGDANGDGVKDGLAFLLGAANPSENAIGRLPTVTESGGDLVLNFNCLPIAARGTATLKVEHSNNLASWTATADVVPDANDPTPDNNVTFVVDTVSEAPLNKVTATIDSAAAGGNGKLFGRLKAEQP
jgi:autotransporter-associated beta strand protein